MTKKVKIIKEVLLEEVPYDGGGSIYYHYHPRESMRDYEAGGFLHTQNPTETYALPVHTLNFHRSGKGREDTYYAFSPQTKEALEAVGIINQGVIEEYKQTNYYLNSKIKEVRDSLINEQMAKSLYLNKYNHLLRRVKECGILGRLKYLFTGKIDYLKIGHKDGHI